MQNNWYTVTLTTKSNTYAQILGIVAADMVALDIDITITRLIRTPCLRQANAYGWLVTRYTNYEGYFGD